MSSYKIDKISLRGIAACVPKNIEYTDSYTLFSESEARNFKKRVGIISKRNSKGRYTTSDLCFHAAEKVISHLKWQKNEIGLILFISQTSDYTLPQTSAILQNKLNLSHHVIAFDINLGCTGWVNGLSIAGSLMNTLNIKKALLLVGETAILSQYPDKSTYPLMGDAGVATALELDNNAKSMYFNSYIDGSKFNAIIAPKSGARYISEMNGNNSELSIETHMDGNAIFEFSQSQVLPSIRDLLHQLSLGVDDIDYFVFHQANKLITESMRRKLGIAENRCPYSIEHFGNTSSASIPLTILTQVGSIKRASRKFICSSFGVGLSVANTFLELSDLHCSELLEI